MVCAALRWPDYIDKSLWIMAMAYAVHLHNHTTHIYSSMSPEKFCTRSKSYHIALHNSRPWVCPVYVLEPILQYENKLPKCMPRSRRSKYLRAYPLHASTVVLVSNLQTGNIRTQFHLVFDDYFETLHAGQDQEPPVW